MLMSRTETNSTTDRIPPDVRPNNDGIVDLQSDDEDDTSPVLSEISTTFSTGNEEPTLLSLNYFIPSPPMFVNIQKTSSSNGEHN